MGAPASATNEIVNRLATTTILDGVTPNQGSVQNEVTNLISGPSATYAQQSYVDTQDSAFQLISYYQTQDQLNLPISQLNAANGVALLGGGKVQLAQMPVLGSGYLQGPYGVTATATGTTAATPLKIADWNVGTVNLTFQPLVFMQCFVTSSMGLPVIEVRMANSTTAPTYAGSILVAAGVGRQFYNDYHALVVMPATATGATPANYSPGYNVWLSAWLYDARGQNSTISSGGVTSGAAFMMRQAT